MKDINYWIEQLKLQTHPEGGYYNEIYVSDIEIDSSVLDADIEGKRKLSTSIYYLLPYGETSKFHSFKSDEIWYYHYGSAITVYYFDPQGKFISKVLGPEAHKGQQLQVVIPAYSIMGANTTEPGSYSLIGCMVSPGFDFKDFKLFDKEELLQLYPDQHELIHRIYSWAGSIASNFDKNQ